MRRANLVNVRLTRNGFEFDARAFWLAVTMIRVNGVGDMFTVALAINLLHHSEIKTAKQMISDCRNVCAPTVTGDLNHAMHASSQVSDKIICVRVIPFASPMRDNQLCAAVYAQKGVEVAALGVPFGCAALTNTNARPQFIQLD